MTERIDTDICVIGAGSGGLSVAAGAAQMGARTVLIERGAMGGECLNTGCVPSKALLAAAAHAQRMREGAVFGLPAIEPVMDFARINAHVKGVVAAIAPNDSVARFEALGVTVIRGHARFRDHRTVSADGREIRARRIVIATGSRPAMPLVPGIETTPCFTNETIFENAQRPDHLVIIGGGPVGMEMAQAYRRLGCRVTLIEAARVLSGDDPELSVLVADRLRREGVEIVEGAKITHVAPKAGGVAVSIGEGEAARLIEGSHLLVATGRAPNIEELDLDKAGVRWNARGIQTDDRLRTANRRVFAVGDVAGGPLLTHAANYQAGIVIRNALFRLPARVDYSTIPHVTYTDPELAHVGMTEAGARERQMKINVLRWPLAENDRAQAGHETEGVIKLVSDRHGRILGVTIVAPGAGELILPWVLAKSQGLKVNAMASLVAPYPTFSEISRRVAGSYYTPALFGPRTRALVRLLGRFG